MVSWKIIGASFVAVLILSLLVVGSFGLRNLLLGVVGKAGQSLGDTPLSGLVTSKGEGPQRLEVILFPQNFSFTFTSPVSVSRKDLSLNDFIGEVSVDYHTNELLLKPAGSPLVINTTIKRTAIENITISSLEIDNTAFRIGLSVNTQNGTLEAADFRGSAVIDSDRIVLDGNASSVKVKIGDLVVTN
jgi:hypothetical protein